jgi:hypothetical protein
MGIAHVFLIILKKRIGVKKTKFCDNSHILADPELQQSCLQFCGLAMYWMLQIVKENNEKVLFSKFWLKKLSERFIFVKPIFVDPTFNFFNFS